MIEEERWLPIQYPAGCSICFKQLTGEVRLLECEHAFKDDFLQGWSSSHSATSSGVTDLMLLADLLATFCMKTDMHPSCATEIKVRKINENYIAYKIEL